MNRAIELLSWFFALAIIALGLAAFIKVVKFSDMNWLSRLYCSLFHRKWEAPAAGTTYSRRYFKCLKCGRHYSRMRL